MAFKKYFFDLQPTFFSTFNKYSLLKMKRKRVIFSHENYASFLSCFIHCVTNDYNTYIYLYMNFTSSLYYS